MRRVTSGEIDRLQNQSLNRIYGRSYIAFMLKYYAFYNPPGSDNISTAAGSASSTQTWAEEGFYGDFVLMRVESRPLPIVPGAVTPGAGMNIYQPVNQITWTASLTLPPQYRDGFYTTQGTNAKNRPYKLEPSPGGTLVHDTLYCNQVWIKTLDGKPMPNDMPNVFDINDEPVITMDGIYFRLEAYGTSGLWTSTGSILKGRFDNDYFHPGTGVVDSKGRVSDAKEYAFHYKTRGDLRRVRQ